MTSADQKRLEWEINLVDSICKERSGMTIGEYVEFLDELDMIHKSANKELITNQLIKRLNA